MTGLRKSNNSYAVIAAAILLVMGSGSPAFASDIASVEAMIGKWVVDFNRGDFKSFVAACAPRAAVVDGFPPYAWQSCNDWIADYQTNNKAMQATHGTLEIGKPIYEELNAGYAYLIYPATFTDTQKGKPVTYKGTWTITLKQSKNAWVFTGSASAWGVNSF